MPTAKEIWAKVKKIQFKTDRLINSVLCGQYASVFKGVGIEFEEVRLYQPGDDIRAIDWNVTARTGKPYIKRYVEERELTVMLLVDLSASQYFGSVNALKSDLTAEIAALLSFLAIKNNDQVGLLLFSDCCEKYLPPQKGRRHVLRVIREILGYRPSGKKTDLAAALGYLNTILKRRSIVFILSDFFDTRFEKALQGLKRRHDVIAIRIEDPREESLPEIGLLCLQDLETGYRTMIDTSEKKVRAEIQARVFVQRKKLERLFRKNKIDYITVSTGYSYLEPLQKLFLKRERRIG
ncbi:MAG TPA: DUF58 domain-containing protein [Firmicutes bacterium]|jgi:uncharacterized protein (DUF58 family)|nr:DUF58 domain-containing protein [Bacillota bacterium]